MRRLSAAVGGDRRAWAIVLLAVSLAISDADLATVGAVAGELERHLHISNVQVGLLATSTAIVGALATVPVGALSDRVPRVPLLMVSVVLWAGAMVMSALSSSYEMLLISRMALGVVTATSGPTLASLMGDLFAPNERAQVYGWIESGEMAGAAFGLVGGGAIAGLLSWRASFLALAIPAVLLAVGLWRKLPEPARGGADRLVAEGGLAAEAPDEDAETVREEVREQGVEPDPDLILHEDPGEMSLLAAIRYVLSIPTNRVLILASALGYFFFTGVQTFAVVLLEQRFGVGQTAASGLIGLAAIGAVVGVLVGGRVSDRRVRTGHVSARVTVAVVCYLVAVVVLIPAFGTTSLVVAIPLFVVGAGAVTAANPPLDAARLDVVPDLIWGRAEGVRTLLRQGATALAPIGFGLVSNLLVARGVGNVLSGTTTNHGDLDGAFLIMLSTLLLSALILAHGRSRFPRDVATAAGAPGTAERSQVA
ncbi:MAG TPA: MFS transporter [Solirubrobacteraceae bacterium]|nr:MFS transporter [Solirubrobacteraceae bacterium]